MSNLRTICRLNHAIYSSFTCCYNRARCQPRLIVSLSNPIQNPNSLKPRLIDSSNVKNVETISCGGFRNHQRRMLSRSANSTDAKSLYDPLENMQQDKQIAATESDDGDSYKPVVVLTVNMQQDKQIAESESESDDGDSYKPVVVLTAENMQQQDKQVAAAAETEETRIFCSDGKYIDAEPLKRESLVVQDAYKFSVSRVKLNRVSELDSELILKVKIFCAVRAKIQDDYASDETLARHKLNEFNSKFCQAHQKNALNFMIAAFELEISSLVDTFMDDVIDIFLKMTDDEAYKILFVNMRDEYSNNVFKEYCERVMFHKWAFE